MILSSTSRLHNESATSTAKKRSEMQQRLYGGDAEILQPLADPNRTVKSARGSGDGDREGSLGGDHCRAGSHSSWLE